LTFEKNYLKKFVLEEITKEGVWVQNHSWWQQNKKQLMVATTQQNKYYAT
jgi:hypothetical protein